MLSGEADCQNIAALKGLAIIYIIFHHFEQKYSQNNINVGIDIYFVLCGYTTISHCYSSNSSNLTNVLKNIVGKLFPIYYFSLFIIFLANILSNSFVYLNFKSHFFSTILFANNIYDLMADRKNETFSPKVSRLFVHKIKNYTHFHWLSRISKVILLI